MKCTAAAQDTRQLDEERSRLLCELQHTHAAAEKAVGELMRFRQHAQVRVTHALEPEGSIAAEVAVRLCTCSGDMS